MKRQPNLRRYSWKFNMYCIFLKVNMASISSCGLIIFANTMKRKKEGKKKMKSSLCTKV